MNNFNPQIGIELERYIWFPGVDYKDLDLMKGFWEYLAESWSGELKLDPASGMPVGLKFELNGQQMLLVNDTGYFELEFPSNVYKDLKVLAEDVEVLFGSLAGCVRDYFGDEAVLLGCGSNAFLKANMEDYMQIRTPKGEFYSLICEGTEKVIGRRFNHQIYVNLTSDQVNVDLPEGFEFETMRALSNVSGLFVALSANSAIFEGEVSKWKSIRQRKQDELVSTCSFEGDKLTGLYGEGLESFDDLFKKLFVDRPLWFVGKDKTTSLVVPQGEGMVPPNVLEFMRSEKPWKGVDVNGEVCEVVSTVDAVCSPLNRINMWNVKPQFNFSKAKKMNKSEAVEALEQGRLFEFFKDHDVKFFAELRLVDSALPGEELAMPALVKGLVVNHGEFRKFAEGFGRKKWQEIYDLAAEKGMDFEVDGGLQVLLKEFVKIAREGLVAGGLGEEKFLDSLDVYVDEKRAPADKVIEAFEAGGLDATINIISILNEN